MAEPETDPGRRIRPGAPRRGPGRVLAAVGIAAAVAVFVTTALLFRPGPRPPRREPDPMPETTRAGAVVRPGEIMSSLLARAGLFGRLADRVISSLRDAGFNLGTMRPGDSLVCLSVRSRPVRLYYARSFELVYRIDVDSPFCRVGTLLRPVSLRTVLVRGVIATSLYEALLDLGERPALIADYTDIFGWEIDFFSEPQPGDSFAVLVQRKYADTTFIGYGSIVAARYRGAVGEFTACRFTDPEGHTDYYNPDGQSLRKTFLKSPLRFSRISSRFGSRRHPILRVRRMHHGLDYVAPKGTLVSCVADGRVTVAGWQGGYGRLVEVAHAGGYVTRYGHLSGFGKGIRAGVAVVQGQTIGLVGSTGLSTDPHLHYEVRRHDSPTNPLKLNPPRAAPVKLAYAAQYQAARESLAARLSTPPALR